MTASRGGVGGGWWLPSVGQLGEFPPENTENGTNNDDSPSTIHSYIPNHHEDSVTRLFVNARIFNQLQTSPQHQLRHAAQSWQALLRYLGLGTEFQKSRLFDSESKIQLFEWTIQSLFEYLIMISYYVCK